MKINYIIYKTIKKESDDHMPVKKFKTLWILIIFSFMSLFLLGCESTQVINPTEHYYINDYADVLNDATIFNIAGEGDRLFNSTDDIMHPGTILIVNTFLNDGENDLETNEVDDLMNRWSIDNNGMGVIINIYFRYSGDALELYETDYAISPLFEIYMNDYQMNFIINRTLYHSNWEDTDRIDLPVMHMYYELLEFIYVNIYDYVNFTYDMNIFELYLDSYQGDDEVYKTPMSYIHYMFYQIGINNPVLWIAFSIFIILIICFAYLMVRRDYHLTMIHKK